jgi:hypothetical protein
MTRDSVPGRGAGALPGATGDDCKFAVCSHRQHGVGAEVEPARQGGEAGDAHHFLAC